MRLTTVRVDGGTAAGRVDGEQVTLLPYEDVGALLGSGPDWRDRAAAATGAAVPLAGADHAPLLPRPEKVMCIGTNYRGHIAETGLETPTHPTVFAKFSRSLIGPYDDIALPANSHAVDWEVELGVVVGAPLRHADPAEALAGVAGYTIVNDVSMRDWQFRTTQFLQGKTFEASTPVGPFLVTPDEVDHARRLGLTCLVDGEVMQDSDTSELVFPVADILAYLSSFITLVPGDLVATGTPAGVGALRKPPVYLTAGRTLVSRIEGLGEQVNWCR